MSTKVVYYRYEHPGLKVTDEISRYIFMKEFYGGPLLTDDQWRGVRDAMQQGIELKRQRPDYEETLKSVRDRDILVAECEISGTLETPEKIYIKIESLYDYSRVMES